MNQTDRCSSGYFGAAGTYCFASITPGYGQSTVTNTLPVTPSEHLGCYNEIDAWATAN